MEDGNHAATDLWSQIFARAAEHPNASLIDPDYDPSADDARARAGFALAGWSAEDIDRILSAAVDRNSNAPATSPGVNPSAEAFHASLCDDVEREMARQGLKSQRNVARGIEPHTGPFASKTGVIMTDESIITVGAFTYRFCGIVAKAFFRTIMLAPHYWQSDGFTTAGANMLLRRNRPAAMYWNRIFMSFSMSGTHSTIPFEPSNSEDVWHVEQIARAMELFIVAHEYGHHHLGHGRNIEADPRAEEFAADQFALRLCRPIGHADRTPKWNPYLASGAGGVIILKALEIVRRFETTLGEPSANDATHPEVEERIARFDSVAVIEPQAFVMLKGFRLASSRAMEAVGALMDDFLSAIPAESLTKLTVMRESVWQELPRV